MSYNKEDLHIKWFEDGTLNASFNCLDRHLKSKGNSVAIIWEGDDPSESKKITYNELVIGYFFTLTRVVSFPNYSNTISFRF